MEKKEKAVAGINNRNNPTKPSREEIRTKGVRTNVPRQSQRPVERSGQQRGHGH